MDTLIPTCPKLDSPASTPRPAPRLAFGFDRKLFEEAKRGAGRGVDAAETMFDMWELMCPRPIVAPLDSGLTLLREL